jgi:hypothetical protein
MWGTAWCALSLALFGFVVTTWRGDVVAAVPMLLGVLLLLSAPWSFIATCVECGRVVRPVSSRSQQALLCSCGCYLQVVDGWLTRVPDEDVATKHPYWAYLPSGKVTMPEGCAVCGAPPTRVIAVGPQANRQMFNIPHCAAHDDGVVCLPYGGALLLLFRSRGYQRRFCEVNGTGPRRPSQSAPRPPRDPATGRWASFWFGVWMAGVAALLFFGIGWIERNPVQVVPRGPLGLLALGLYAFLGRTGIVVVFALASLLGFFAFATSFGKRPKA